MRIFGIKMEISKLLVKLIHVLQHISGDVAQKVASQSEKLWASCMFWSALFLSSTEQWVYMYTCMNDCLCCLKDVPTIRCCFSSNWNSFKRFHSGYINTKAAESFETISIWQKSIISLLTQLFKKLFLQYLGNSRNQCRHTNLIHIYPIVGWFSCWKSA